MTSSPAPSPYRWLVLLLAWAAFTMTAVDRSTWGPASGAVSESLVVPLAAIGIFATCYYIGYVISNACGGFLTDWFGPRLVLSVTSVVAGLLMFLFGFTTSIVMGLVVQGLLGLFAGMDYSAGVKLVTSWFGPRERGLAMGLFTSAAALGTVIANAVVPSLILASGWGTSYHFFGLVTAVIALAALVLLRDAPVSAGTKAGGHQAVAAGSPVAGLRDALRNGRPDLRPLLRNRDVFLLAAGGFGAFWGTYGFVTWSNLLMVRGSGISPVQAGVVVTLFGALAVFAKPLVGFLADRLRLGYRRPLVVMLLSFAALLVLFGSLDNLTAFLWTAPLLGLVGYGYTPLMAAITPRLVGDGLTGSTAGGVNAFWQLGSVLVPAAIGPVFAATGSFWTAFVILAVGPVLGAIAFYFLHDDRPAAPSPATPRGAAASAS